MHLERQHDERHFPANSARFAARTSRALARAVLAEIAQREAAWQQHTLTEKREQVDVLARGINGAEMATARLADVAPRSRWERAFPSFVTRRTSYQAVVSALAEHEKRLADELERATATRVVLTAAAQSYAAQFQQQFPAQPLPRPAFLPAELSRLAAYVFRIYYDRLARDAQGQRLEKQDETGRAAAVQRTLTEMRTLAQEMAALETRESLDAAQLEEQTAERGAVNLAARVIDLRAESLRFPVGLSFAAKERLLTRTLPELDYRLEHGVPLPELRRAIDRRLVRPDPEVEQEKMQEIGGFLKAYLDERLRDPETRALHSSAVFRAIRATIVSTRTPAELGRAAEDLLRTNQRRSVRAWRKQRARRENRGPRQWCNAKNGGA